MDGQARLMLEEGGQVLLLASDRSCDRFECQLLTVMLSNVLLIL